jgi:hypothetical protein
LCASAAGRGAIAARGSALYGVRVGLPAPERIGRVAQWLEPTAHNGLVGGSNPSRAHHVLDTSGRAAVGFGNPIPMSRTSLFSRQAWDKNVSIYEVIRTMPFNAQLASGTLSEARFKHYITQDAHYLIGFGRALTLAAAKAPNADRIVLSGRDIAERIGPPARCGGCASPQAALDRRSRRSTAG